MFFPYQCCLTEKKLSNNSSVRQGYDRMVVRFTSSYTISAFHHYSCKFGSRTCQVLIDITRIFKSFAIGDPFSRGEACDPFNWLYPTSFLFLSQARTWISNVICHCLFMFIELRWEVFFRFVDIGGMFDHYCLYLFFITILSSLPVVSLTYQTGRPNITEMFTVILNTNNSNQTISRRILKENKLV